ncbi:hypothetical protein ABZ891_20030 [Streptomyces sp. NPDC047023]|uniref:hypothetical protein n=1 Tax=Streptomyces sp. NPDC047023 TaxID=3155139 RepID=UPI0033F0C62A
MKDFDSLLLAGELTRIGNSWLNTLEVWADKGLKLALLAVVVYTVAKKVSVKAGIGALIGMVLALGIYGARDDLSRFFKDEINNPSVGQGQVTVVVGEHTGVNRGVL